jgi:hypothetical protein
MSWSIVRFKGYPAGDNSSGAALLSQQVLA